MEKEKIKINDGDILKNVLKKTVIMGGSDIHIDPFEKFCLIRIRVDGLLVKMTEISLGEYQCLLSMIKAVAGLRLDGLHMQDGRVSINIEGSKYDIRVSILPVFYGECAVLRMVACGSEFISPHELGFTDEQVKIILNALSGGGLLLITGPTGSGKSTTLYSLINTLTGGTRSVITLEDPVERIISGVRQVPVQTRASVSFASGLRAILRQDPDVIMLGEIRDSETARIAVHSAMTGHLVLSTLHARSAAEAHIRLMDMGVEGYSIASSLKVIISQRLVRKNCPACSCIETENIGNLEKVSAGLGCNFCSGTGFKGRMVVAEVLEINSHIRKKIYEKVSAEELERNAEDTGFINIKSRLLTLINSGYVSHKESIRCLQDI